MVLARRDSPPAFSVAVVGGSQREQADVRIADHDLIADGDFLIPGSVDLDEPPFIGGSNWSVLGVESSDSNNFDVTFEYGQLAADGTFTVDFTYDSSDNNNLQGDHSYVISIRPIRDRLRIRLSDTSGASQNNISGGLNSH